MDGMGIVHHAGPKECMCSSAITKGEKFWDSPPRCLVGRDMAASKAGLLHPGCHGMRLSVWPGTCQLA